MKATNASGGSRRSTRKTPRNMVSSPWVHKNQSNIVVSRGCPKGSNKKSELKKKIYQTATPKKILNPDIVKLQLALETPVSNENGQPIRSSQRKKASLRRSLNERDLVKIESGNESPKIITNENGESKKEIEIKKLNLDDEMEVEEGKESQIAKEEAIDAALNSPPNEDPKNWCLIL